MMKGIGIICFNNGGKLGYIGGLQANHNPNPIVSDGLKKFVVIVKYLYILSNSLCFLI